MGRDLGLVEDDAIVRIDPGRDHAGRDLAGGAAQLHRIMRWHGDRMHVDNAEDRRIVALQLHPVADRPEVIAKMQVTSGLNAREDAVHLTRSIGLKRKRA